MTRTDIVLVSMPFAAVERPSLALGLLRAVLDEAGLCARTHYANLGWAEQIGPGLNQLICETGAENLAGEWVFAGGLFPEYDPDPSELLERLELRYAHDARARRWTGGRSFAAALCALREQAQTYVERVVDELLALRPRIVGCTSTFHQHCASLALLRQLRARAPEVVTLLGGANCEGEMGLASVEAFPWLDFVVSGEAEELIAPLCRDLLEHGREIPTSSLPEGVLRARPKLSCVGQIPRVVVEDLDRSPTPNYADYFEQLQASSLAEMVQPGLPVESSRGCWWGKKHHCTFCGLNGSAMAHRTKRPERVLEQLEELDRRHGLTRFEMVDNIIAMDYFDTLLPKLRGRGYTLFYESKANLQRRHIQLFAEAGVRWIQPGIEGLSDELLRAINKGCTGLANVQTLKWCREAGLRALWGLLIEIPGDDDDWYAETARWLPRLEHLQPPGGLTPIVYQRYSPYHARPEAHGLELESKRDYAFIYPFDEQLRRRLAYYFDDHSAQYRDRRPGPGLRALALAVMNWHRVWSGETDLRVRRFSAAAPPEPPTLELRVLGPSVVVHDTCRVAMTRDHRLDGLSARIYLACDRVRRVSELARELSTAARPLSPASIEPVLRDLDTRQLVLRRGERVLALALRKTPTASQLPRQNPGGYLDLEAAPTIGEGA